jgi:hypothetical protein
MDTNKKDEQNINQLLSKKRNLDDYLKSDLKNLSKIDIEKKNKIKLIESESEIKKNKIKEAFEKKKEEYFEIIKLEER